VEQDTDIFLDWLEKAAKQNNPMAMNSLGYWFWEAEDGDDEKKAAGYYLRGAELGWTKCMEDLAMMLKNGEGCKKDLRQAAIWSAKGNSYVFWEVLRTSHISDGKRTGLGSDFSQVCYSLGWGLYWYMYGTDFSKLRNFYKAFGISCLNYYCSCVELQQKSICTFLLCWKESVGVKDVGVLIAKMVWDGREDNLLKSFEETD
jgi:hypothetical protein